MTILLICGSRSQGGQTGRAARAVTDGAADAGCAIDAAFLPTLRLEHCRQCDDDGWGLCRREGRCVIDDDFAALVARLRKADALVVATPVYYSDLSESLRAFLDRLRRTCIHAAGREGVAGKPVLGLCVAGGGGGGAPDCCATLQWVLTTCGLDVVDMEPVRRQNLKDKEAGLALKGRWLASRPTSSAAR